MYICAWQAPALPPTALISSRITHAAVRPRPAPPYSSRDQRRQPAALGQRRDELRRIAVGLELAPVLAGKAFAQLAHRGADLGELRRNVERHSGSCGTNGRSSSLPG